MRRDYLRGMSPAACAVLWVVIGTLLFIAGLPCAATTPVRATIDSISPDRGPAGTNVIITGSDLGNVTAVRFNGVSATFVRVSARQLRATVPVAATTGYISVISPAGTYTFDSSPFTVTPKITGFSPTVGRAGDTVIINGTGFRNATNVYFHGAGATFTVLSPTQIRAKIPLDATTGPISVITQLDETSSIEVSSAGTFTVLPTPNPFAARYTGTYEGAETGNLILTVDTAGRVISTIASASEPGVFTGRGTVDVFGLLRFSRIADPDFNGPRFEGRLRKHFGVLRGAGTWESRIGSGRWTVRQSPAVCFFAGTYRVTYTGLESGTFTLQIDANGFVTARISSLSVGNITATGLIDSYTGRITFTGGFNIGQQPGMVDFSGALSHANRTGAGLWSSTTGTFGSWSAIKTSALVARDTVSPVVSPALSKVIASASLNLIRLTFSDSMEVEKFSDPSHYTVIVNGNQVKVESASYSATSRTVILSLPEGSLRVGDQINVYWQDQEDQNKPIEAIATR